MADLLIVQLTGTDKKFHVFPQIAKSNVVEMQTRNTNYNISNMAARLLLFTLMPTTILSVFENEQKQTNNT